MEHNLITKNCTRGQYKKIPSNNICEVFVVNGLINKVIR